MRRLPLILVSSLVVVVAAAGPAYALDPPHDATNAISCGECHIPHGAQGAAITNVAGNANLCETCHVVGGPATNKPFAETDQALPGPGLPTGATPTGTSHRWDSGASGHAEPDQLNTSTGTVESGGTFTGRYAKTYTITIGTTGDVAAATFSWTCNRWDGDTPALCGSASGLATGTGVSLDKGITVTFTDVTSPSFVAGDVWRVYVRTDISLPSNSAMAARISDGKIMCSTCHDQHSQANQPFDPSAPEYGGPGTGEGRHFQRLNNDTNQMCKDCHSARNLSQKSPQGWFCQGGVEGPCNTSHPVGVAISGTTFQSPASVPLDSANNVACMSCHFVHDLSASPPTNNGTLLRVADHTTLCTECHTLADTATPASHLDTLTGVLWPGGQYGSTFPEVTDTGRTGWCTNCHQPHGWPDSGTTTQDYRTLLVDREENLCYTCHDGSPALKDIQAQFAKSYKHPVATSGIHSPSEDGASAAYGASPTNNRHAECVDCHNPHWAKGDAPVAPDASSRLKGVGRVVRSGGSLVYIGPEDTTAVKEYEICYKCHSSWTTLPAGTTDKAAQFDPANAAFHPVEAVGKNTDIDSRVLVSPWNAASRVYCTDCHSSDDTAVRGPHGSVYPPILKKAYFTGDNASPPSTNLCFDCHVAAQYLTDTEANETTYTHFRDGRDSSSKNRHYFHIVEQQTSCKTCHFNIHGATTAHLVDFNPAVVSPEGGQLRYDHLPDGGECTLSCHGRKHDPRDYRWR